MNIQDIINFVFSGGTFEVKDPITQEPTGQTVTWSLEAQVAEALQNNKKINNHSKGYEIAEVNMETGTIDYRYSTSLIPEKEKIIIMYLDTSNPPSALKYQPNLKDILQSYQQ